MKDLKIGDRILMMDAIVEEEIYMSVGTVKEVRSSDYIYNCTYNKQLNYYLFLLK